MNKPEFIERVRAMENPLLTEESDSYHDFLNLYFLVSSGIRHKFCTRSVKLSHKQWVNAKTEVPKYYLREEALRKQINAWFNEAVSQPQ